MPIPKIVLFSKKSEDGTDLQKLLEPDPYLLRWTDSGPETICYALSGELDAVVVFLGGRGHRELDYIPCLNRIDHKLPVIVISRHDTLSLQREVRKHRVFYYLPQPVEAEEIRAVLKDAVATSRAGH